VVVLGTFRGRAAPTGQEWTSDFVHVYTIRDGKTWRFDSYFDTAAFLAAHRRTPVTTDSP
jgi:ketosteroid isomerase-like protein